MTRNMTLAAVLAMLPLSACDQNAPGPKDDAHNALEANAKAVENIVANDEASNETAPVEAATPKSAETGMTAPDVTVLNTKGEPVSFDTLSGASGTVLVFTRSAEWCPYCQQQLIQLKAVEDALANGGWALAAVSYDSPDILATFAEKHDITYALLSDTDSETIKRWDLLNKEMVEGTRYYGIPHPTIAYIGADGTLLRIDTNTDYKVRPSPEEVIDAATGLSAAADGDGQ